MHRIPVGVLGASGYAGRELCALVLRHPRLRLAFASADAQRGTTARIAGSDVPFVATEDAPLAAAAMIFTALPHGAARPWVGRARAAGAKVVDLSADLRPTEGDGAARDGVPYGLTEMARSALSGADVVANPGCYATAVLLALAPLLESGTIAAGATVTINAASGVTGAGYTARHDLLFAEVDGDYRAYATGNTHHHLGEMRALVSALGADCDLAFTPHLLPVARGILVTLTVPLAEELPDPLALWRERFAGEAFVDVVSRPPTLRDVTHRNACCVTAIPLQGTRRPALLVLAAIDNLLKGAAGQAVQNANLMLGLEETMGLPA